MKTSTKIIIAVAVVIFVLMGLFTYKVGSEEEDENNTELVENDGDKDNNSGEKGGDTKKSGNVQTINSDAEEGDPYKELDELIGLEDVKREVHELADFVKVQKMREAQGLKVPNMSYHLVFTGNPGTGKTTVARIVARIYKDLGILKKGHTIETDRSGLVAEYMGQTAIKTNAIIDSALNGVLFIDEAYALVPKGNHQGDYGEEAISTLLKRMEDDRDKLVVIIAGYTDEMKDFINSNPGLQSRFNRYIDFPDYTPDELTQIFKMYVKKNQYSIDSETEHYLKEKLEYIVSQKDRNFGNARYVRNVFEKSIQNQANRVSKCDNPTSEMLTLITREDIEKAIAGVKRSM